MRGKLALAFALAALAISGVFYFLFDQYVTSVGLESVKTWMMGEENALAEGNLLSSVTKTQKILLSSEFVRGIVVYDISTAIPRTLVEFGHKPSVDLKSFADGLSVVGVGFLEKEIFLTLAHNPDLIIGFSVKSEKVNLIFLLTNGIFFVLLSAFSAILLTLKRKEQNRTDAYAKKASQASHDLAQPLMALNSIVASRPETDETAKSLRFVIDRINLIAAELGRQNKKEMLAPAKPVKPASVVDSIASLVEERKAAVRGKEIFFAVEIAAPLNFLEESENSFLRVLSNLIQNSTEAIEGKGEITISATETSTEYLIDVSDTGHGLPADVLPKLGSFGFSYQKDNGNGLGLFSAKQFVEGLGGKLSITSERLAGTRVRMAFPKSHRRQAIYLTETMTVVFLDDEEICHDAWKGYLKHHGLRNPHHFFSSVDEFEAFMTTAEHDELFLFSDFDLHSSLNGLDVIEKFGLQDQAALVTGHIRDEVVVQRATGMGVPILDKANPGSFSIQFI